MPNKIGIVDSKGEHVGQRMSKDKTFRTDRRVPESDSLTSWLVCVTPYLIRVRPEQLVVDMTTGDSGSALMRRSILLKMGDPTCCHKSE